MTFVESRGSDEDGLHITSTTRDRVVRTDTSRRRNLDCILGLREGFLGARFFLLFFLVRVLVSFTELTLVGTNLSTSERGG